MKPVFWWICRLLLIGAAYSIGNAALAASLPATDSSHTIAVLDFVPENPSLDREQVKVAADFMEMALQRNEIATLERRQIRLILSIRCLNISSSRQLRAKKRAQIFCACTVASNKLRENKKYHLPEISVLCPLG